MGITLGCFMDSPSLIQCHIRAIKPTGAALFYGTAPIGLLVDPHNFMDK